MISALLVGTAALLGAAPPAPPSPGVDILSTVFYKGLGGISCKSIYLHIPSPHAPKKDPTHTPLKAAAHEGALLIAVLRVHAS